MRIKDIVTEYLELPVCYAFVKHTADANQLDHLGDSMRDGGKGDKRRPLVIPEEQFNAQWDAIFKKSNPLADKLVKQIEEHLKQQEYITPED